MRTLPNGATAAQVPNGKLYVSYTYYNADLSLNGSNLNGLQATLEGKLVPVLGIVADFTGALRFPELPGPLLALHRPHDSQRERSPI